MRYALARLVIVVFIHQSGKLWDLLWGEAAAAAPLSPKGKPPLTAPAGAAPVAVVLCRHVTHVVGAQPRDRRHAAPPRGGPRGKPPHEGASRGCLSRKVVFGSASPCGEGPREASCFAAPTAGPPLELMPGVASWAAGRWPVVPWFPLGRHTPRHPSPCDPRHHTRTHLFLPCCCRHTIFHLFFCATSPPP